MTAKAVARHLAGAGIAALALLLQDVHAAPNIYSETADTSNLAARLSVSSPRAGLYEPGDRITIRWRKTTPGKQVRIYLYSATSSGLRKKKLETITPSAAIQRKFTSRGGAIRWTLPSSLSPGRYIIVVKAKLDIATSEAFAVQAASSSGSSSGPQLGPSRLEAAGEVVKTDVKWRGKKGSVVLKNASGEITYEWGAGKCPRLLGGLPGALATMAAIGKVEIEPRVRTVTDGTTVLQRCIVGLVVKSGLPPSAVPPSS